MKIAVNNRVEFESGTGIPSYIRSLHASLIAVDKVNEYIFICDEIEKASGKFKNFKNVFFDLFYSYWLVKNNGTSVFFAPANILPFFTNKKVKSVLTVHDLSFITNPENQSWFFNLYYKYAVKISAKRAIAVVADSENTKKDLITYYDIDDKKISVIYPGIKEIFLNTELNGSTPKDYFLSVTTHPKRKNINSVLHAMSKSEELRKMKYIIVGKIYNQPLLELKQLISTLKLESQVELRGFVSDEDLKILYENAKFVVYPSFYEGFGFPVLEAMACGAPVITSNNSSLIELSPNREWLVDPYNVNDIVGKMEKVAHLSNVERRELVSSNKLFSNRFTWANSTAQIINLFEELENL